MYFFPDPHGHGSLRPTLGPVAVRGSPRARRGRDGAPRRPRGSRGSPASAGRVAAATRLDGRDLLPGQTHLEELLDHGLLEVVHHRLEHVEGFLLVLGQRVALAVAAKADALLEVVHVQEVVLPELVDAAELAVLPARPITIQRSSAVEQLRAEEPLALAIVALTRP